MHGLRLNLPQALDPRRRFLLPLRRATENSGVFHRDFLMRQYRVDRIARILRLHQLYSVAVVKAAFVTKTTFLIKDKGVRGRLRTIRPGHRLRVAIVKIGILQMLVFGADFHLARLSLISEESSSSIRIALGSLG